MILLVDLVTGLNSYLDSQNVKDYCPNGLQVQGAVEVNKVVTAVTASLDLLKVAADKEADAVLVHHGYFWKGDAPEIVGPLYHRLKQLLVTEMSLLAYHLPLDLHPVVGNNALLGAALEVDTDTVQTFSAGGVPGLGWKGEFSVPLSAKALFSKLETILSRKPMHIAGSAKPIKRVAWCTGAAQDCIVEAANEGVDAFITGEVSERTTHMARELGLHFYAAGHHATERFGIKALGEWLADQYSIDVEFVDIDNPV